MVVEVMKGRRLQGPSGLKGPEEGNTPERPTGHATKKFNPSAPFGEQRPIHGRSSH